MQFSDMSSCWWDFLLDNSLNAASRNLILTFKVNPCSKRCSSDCSGYHNLGEIRRIPLDKKTGCLVYEDRLCPDVNNCPLRSECPLAHSLSEVRFHPYRYRCSWCSLSSSCSNQKLCPDAHNTYEIRVCGMPRRYLVPEPLPIWSDSDRLFFIICWIILIDTHLLDLERVKSIHANLVAIQSPEALMTDGAADNLEQLVRRANTARSQLSTATSTLDN
jgi:hypothetical protein